MMSNWRNELKNKMVSGEARVTLGRLYDVVQLYREEKGLSKTDEVIVRDLLEWLKQKQ